MKNYPEDRIKRVTQEKSEKKLKYSTIIIFLKKPFSKNNILKVV